MLKDFERVSPESQGISSKALEAFVDELESGFTQMHGLSVMRHGKIICEGWWAPFAQGLNHMCASLTKTYMGTAIGIAYTEGLLSLDDHLTKIFPEFMPENPSPHFDKLTVRNVLRFSTGMTAFPTMEGNWVKNFIGMELTYEPGTKFFYNSVASTFLGKIIKKLTGKDVFAYLNEKLFPYIGIDGERLQHGIAPEGQDMWAWRTISTTEDNLRLMKLYLDNGMAGDRRILAEDYVKLATSPQTDNRPEGREPNPEMMDAMSGYGYQMWMCQYPGSYRADGAGGQYAVVIPDKDMIVSVNEDAKRPDKTLKAIWNILIPALEEEALPEDETEWGRLKRRMQHLAIDAPVYQPYAKVKASATGRYRAGGGAFDLYCKGMVASEPVETESISFTFNAVDGSVEWLGTNKDFRKIEFAMDGSRRWNRLYSPWQAATQCYANGYFEDDETFVLQLLWPEDNSGRDIRFTFRENSVTIREKKNPLPHEKGGDVDIIAYRF